MSNPETPNSIKLATLKNGLILGLFALISTVLIALTHLITKDRISEEIEAALARRLNDIVSSHEYDNDVYHDCRLVQSESLLGSKENLKVYRMRKQQEAYGVFMTTIAPDGYAGKIRLVIGIYYNGQIAGVRVTEHSETPGLGDKIEIEKSSWISQFDGRSLNNTDEENWLVKKDGGDFDALTGATITPRAIVKSVHHALQFFEQNKASLFSNDHPCGVKQ